MEKDLKNKTLGELEELVIEMNHKKFLAGYIFDFIHSKNICEISEITPLGKGFRGELVEQGYYITKLKVAEKLADTDGTVKYLFELSDGCFVEAVLITEGKRRTLCISTQVGCAMGCVFCATGKLKFTRNLTAGEIIDQVYRVAEDDYKISNVVYMGMGEPFLNYRQVLRSVRILNHAKGFNLGIRHITISTCGLTEGILRLAEEDIHPRLAISLNAADDKTRSEIMAINKKYPLAKLLKAVRLYQRQTGQRVTFEYVLIKGKNDKASDAQALIKKLAGIKCNVNLIEYNPHPGCDLVGPGREKIKRFADVLDKGGIETVIRLRKGLGIRAGCGQLGAERINPANKTRGKSRD